MSDTDPTPETPVTIGDRLGWWRGELKAQLTALSTQLATQHTELLGAITELRGAAPSGTLAQIRDAVSGLKGTGEPTTLEDIARLVATGSSGPGSTVYSILLAIGELTHGPANWTVRQLLEAIHIAIDGPLIDTVTIPAGCSVPTDGSAMLLLDSALLEFDVLDTFVTNGIEYTNYIPVYPILYGVTRHYTSEQYLDRDMALAVLYTWWTSHVDAMTVYCCFSWDGPSTQKLYYDVFASLQLGNGTVTAEGATELQPSGHINMLIFRPILETDSYAGIAFAAPTGTLPQIYLKMWSSTFDPS
jgi:hypothetical protein